MMKNFSSYRMFGTCSALEELAAPRKVPSPDSADFVKLLGSSTGC